MPIALPGNVSALPLAEDGINVLLIGPGVAFAGGLGQPPVDDQRLAVFADDDVARLDVAMEDAAAVSVADRIADVHESPEQLAERQRPLTWSASAGSAWNRSMASLRVSPRMNRMA